MTMNGNMYTQNSVLINRPKDVTILSVSPARVRVGATNLAVALIGRGFIENFAAKCKLYFDAKNTSWFEIYNTKYVSSVQYNCIVPTAFVMTYPGSYMTLALDGQIYSSSSAAHSVLGPGDNIYCTPDRISRGSQPIVEFPPWPSVFVRDKNLNVLYDFDDQPVRTANIDLAVPDPTFVWINATNQALMNSTLNMNKTYYNYGYKIFNGTGTLDHYAAYVPPVGLRNTRITVDGKWTRTFVTAIIPGALARIRFKTQPASPADVIGPGTVLPQTAEILTVDTGENAIDDTGIILNVSFVSFDENGSVNYTFSPQGQVQVNDIGVAGISPFKTIDADKKPIVFGTDYAIYCVVSNDPTKFAFSAKFHASCPSTLFQITGESVCRSCPDTQALCDGT
ncbi:MAG: hypothetical protein Q8M03_00855, partial [Legionella sp.]|nr:hypothetical protein [Legionella sp.]